MEAQLAQTLGFEEGLQFIDSAIKGVDPKLLGIGPVPTVTQLLHKHKMTMQDIDAYTHCGNAFNCIFHIKQSCN